MPDAAGGWEDALAVAVFAAVMALTFMIVAAVVLSYFVALRSPPSQRAAWTAGIAYLLVALILIFGFLPGYELVSVLAAIPAALVVFLGCRLIFQRAWIDAADERADQDDIEDDDWKIGLFRLGAVVTVVVGIVALKLLL